ncbi:hypothetical protein [Mucilaginibacter sp. KACC 22063]|uniref:hypothetical protein n=1 Tax=Mucilaginibacter sp. KACC 22063 TaxID=3025666 RepID=UPI0023663246|nr:hypothetical protein [Mucilaginibacter sp. KACC 22063]WDF56440.1 hypothetical protein PQ461_05165 [Mucilaginibacter sp. KACC 22063]
MLKSNRLVRKPVLLLSFIVLCAASALCFKPGMNAEEWLTWGNRCLYQCFDPNGDAKLKKWELSLTGDSFVRLRKTYANGKQEYYSFHLHRFSDINYLGTSSAGILQFKTIADDIIVQTYDDPRGNVDSMTTALSISVRNMEPERVDSLRNALLYLKEKDKQ